MPLVSKRELRELFHIHYIIELTLALSYIILKTIPWTATTIFGTSEFISWERELLMFTCILIAFKTRRRGHVNFLPYLSSACTMAKFSNFILFFYVKPIYGFTYSAVLLTHILLFPKPKYKGPDHVTYFIGEEFERRLAADKSSIWLVEFYATWNPDCTEFASVFKELSAKYATNNLKFGKIDVTRSPKIAEKYDISDSVTTRTLPTVILFKNGREHMRRPLIDNRNRPVPFSFSYENVVNTFQLA